MRLCLYLQLALHGVRLRPRHLVHYTTTPPPPTKCLPAKSPPLTKRASATLPRLRLRNGRAGMRQRSWRGHIACFCV